MYKILHGQTKASITYVTNSDIHTYILTKKTFFEGN